MGDEMPARKEDLIRQDKQMLREFTQSVDDIVAICRSRDHNRFTRPTHNATTVNGFS